MMNEWQQRVIEERRELANKLVKLREFLASGELEKLPRLDRNLLVAQRGVMQKYKDILDRRIEAFQKS